MADIFSAQPGRVVAVTGNGLPMRLIVGNNATDTLPDSHFRNVNGGTFADFRSIIQSVGVSGQSGVEFQHTLRDFIYVYVFGERVGELTVGGLAFQGACGDTDPNAPSGFELVLDYYKNFRVTSYPLALTVAIGTLVTFDAFLTGINAQLINPETNLTQFNMRLTYVPDQVDLVDDEFNVDLGDFLP